MPIDPSIALQARMPQIDDPLTVRAKQAQLSDLLGRQQVQQMQLEDAQRSRTDQATLADIYKQSGGDYTQTRDLLAQRGLGAQIPAYEKSHAESQKALTEQQLKQLELAKKKSDITGQTLASLVANPQVGHQDVIQAVVGLVQNGIVDAEQGKKIVADLPGRPEMLRSYLLSKGMQVMDASKQIEMLLPKTEVRNMGGQDQVFQTNNLTGQITPGQTFAKTMTPGEAASNQVARGNLGVAQARLAFDQNQPKGVYDPERGVLVDPRTAAATPVTLGGAPLPPKPGTAKLTEDQGKATGWLTQANNAFTNMQAAMVDSKGGKTGAEMPGVGDALGGNLPGLRGAIGRTLMPASRQKFNQASSSLAEALLRAATGAGVNKDEAAQKVMELTPQFGEGSDVIKQKMDAIPLYLESLKVRAGPGADKAPVKSGTVDWGSLK